LSDIWIYMTQNKQQLDDDALAFEAFKAWLKQNYKDKTWETISGIVVLCVAILMCIAFFSYFSDGKYDQSILENVATSELTKTDNGIKNAIGAVGARISDYFINDCFGVSALFIVIFLGVVGLKLLRMYNAVLWQWFVCCVFLLAWDSIAMHFFFQSLFADSCFFYLGGHHGLNASRWIASQIGDSGLFLLLLVSMTIFMLFAMHERTLTFLNKLFQFPHTIQGVLQKGTSTTESETTPKSEEKEGNATDEATTDGPKPDTNKEKIVPANDDMPFEVSRGEEAPIGITHGQTEREKTDTTIELPDNPSKQKDDSSQNDVAFSIETNNTNIGENTATTEPATGEEKPATGEEQVEMQPYNPRLDLENYQFPALDLLAEENAQDMQIDMDEHKANKERIVQVLRSFGIEIGSIKASVGPTVTLYEITLVEGVRISKVRNLEDDIALSLSALGIRIIAPMPGKGTIGIEVPNAKPQIVSMRSILGSRKFQETTFELPLALGKTITNEIFMVDLTKAPHMLVAGATGMGKSVGLNAIVTSLLYKKHPSELKFVIIDPKKVEFSVYAPIENHYLAKLPDVESAIITDVKEVERTLLSLCQEMDTRYDLLKQAGCRTIKEYNAKFVARQLNPEKGHHFMPYIVVVIDEFGDLIMTAGKNIETPICRIAQLARAVGIHAIIATQRPTTNIITGTIKANFPARIAFRVSAMIDSRIILDRPGAQQLIGRGDMLYLQNADPVRVQCAFVDTPEVERITSFIHRQQGYPETFLLPEVYDENEGGSLDVDMGHLDPMFEEAAQLVVSSQQGSTSLIQRKLSIGYNRAGRLMDQLEKSGVVGPAQGSKPREVLIMDMMELDAKIKILKQ